MYVPGSGCPYKTRRKMSLASDVRVIMAMAQDILHVSVLYEGGSHYQRFDQQQKKDVLLNEPKGEQNFLIELSNWFPTAQCLCHALCFHVHHWF